MKILLFTSFVLMTASCERDNDLGGMAGGGTSNEINQGSNSDGGSDGGDDTGGYGAAPSIESAEAMWNENSDGYWQILCSLTYSDADGDLDGGKVGVSALIDGTATTERWFMIDGNEALHDEEASLIDVTILFEGEAIDPDSGDIELVLRLKDAALNVSAEFPVIPTL
jgi:hypothetical protein